MSCVNRFCELNKPNSCYLPKEVKLAPAAYEFKRHLASSVPSSDLDLQLEVCSCLLDILVRISPDEKIIMYILFYVICSYCQVDLLKPIVFFFRLIIARAMSSVSEDAVNQLVRLSGKKHSFFFEF